MEYIVARLLEEAFQEMLLTCCPCEKCRDDVMAIALNNLPFRYVSTDLGDDTCQSGFLRSAVGVRRRSGSNEGDSRCRWTSEASECFGM